MYCLKYILHKFIHLGKMHVSFRNKISSKKSKLRKWLQIKHAKQPISSKTFKLCLSYIYFTFLFSYFTLHTTNICYSLY